MSIDYFIEKYNKLVYKICYNMLGNSQDAEDITQESYLKLYANLGRYLNLEENEIKNILCKIALNSCKDILKSKVRKLENLTNTDIISLENYVSDNNIEEEILKQEKTRYIEKIINELKQPYCDILYAYYIDELSLDEISLEMSVTKGTLKTQLYRGKKLLKDKLEIVRGGDNLL
ncbi:MAG: sigma-70 family RNA polymerase sigma factor [Clostridia bacterium]